MTKMKKLIGSAMIGATVLGGVTTVGAGLASAAPNQPGNPGVTQNDHRNDQRANRDQRARPRTNGENPNWRPGRVFHQGQWRTPVWDNARHHWGFWLGPVWIPIG